MPKWLRKLLQELDDFRLERHLTEIRLGLFYVSLKCEPERSLQQPQARVAATNEMVTTEKAEVVGANVTSPIVGIAYLASEPGAAPFVKLGDIVSEGQTLLIIEAMKVMNEIKATHSGRGSRIFVEDAEPVEYHAELMLIE